MNTFIQSQNRFAYGVTCEIIRLETDIFVDSFLVNVKNKMMEIKIVKGERIRTESQLNHFLKFIVLLNNTSVDERDMVVEISSDGRVGFVQSWIAKGSNGMMKSK